MLFPKTKAGCTQVFLLCQALAGRLVLQITNACSSPRFTKAGVSAEPWDNHTTSPD